MTGELIGAFASVTLRGFGAGWQFDVLDDGGAHRVSLAVLQVVAPPPCRVDELGTALLALLALAGWLLPGLAAARSRTEHPADYDYAS